LKKKESTLETGRSPSRLQAQTPKLEFKSNLSLIFNRKTHNLPPINQILSMTDALLMVKNHNPISHQSTLDNFNNTPTNLEDNSGIVSEQESLQYNSSNDKSNEAPIFKFLSTFKL
jgi:hypothetical protein